MRRSVVLGFLLVGALVSISIWHGLHSLTAPALAASGNEVYVVPPLPKGPEGDLISYGKHILQDTHKYAGQYAVANLSCEACHMNAGTKAHGGSLVGVYAKFPQWSKRAKRFIALQDRLAECFLYSMNGITPAYDSREMIALTAYIAYISRGTAVGKGASSQGLNLFKPPQAPNIANGSKLYAAKCSACHAANGAGGGAFTPLWGATSVNSGAGMHRLTTMAAFVRYNMPSGSAPNTLTQQQAYDVSAFVLSHPRPKFDARRTVSFPAQKASFF